MNYENLDKEKLIKILKKKDKVLERLNLEKERLNYYANRDDMTGVLNRRAGLKFLKRELCLSKVNGKNVIICFVDIDGLKMINDTFGHKEGDKLIINLTKILREGIRKTDCIIRMGGDEFLLVFPETSMKEIDSVWDRICKRVEEINRINNGHDLSFSYGFYEYGKYAKKDMSINEIIQKADEEMYRRKLKKGGI